MLRITEVEAELLRGLEELRYLTLAQVQSLWFSDRQGEGGRIRLRRMCSGGLVRRVPLHVSGGSAYRLTAEGVAFLRTKRDGDFALSEELSQLYLEHLLATNSVFLALAEDTWRWDELPFDWCGSHRARLSYTELAGGELGAAFQRHNRVLAPDALIAPRGHRPGPRCFLELDRSTETISEAPGRRSIVGKLKAYHTLLRHIQPGTNKTAYDQQFADHRPPRIVFVVAANDPAGRRGRSILAAAKQVASELDVLSIPLADAAALRLALLPNGADSAPQVSSAPRQPAAELSATSLQRFIDFHVGAAPVLKRVTDPEERTRLGALYNSARDVLLRLKNRSAATD